MTVVLIILSIQFKYYDELKIKKKTKPPSGSIHYDNTISMRHVCVLIYVESDHLIKSNETVLS